MTINWRGAWGGTAAYAVNDGVFHQGLGWAALAANTGVRPGTNDAIWQQTAPALNWRGLYAAGIGYAINDAVVDAQGQGWSAIQAGGGNTPGVNSAYWQAAALAPNYRGAYAAATTYAAGDAVRYLGGTYKLIVNTATGEDPTDYPALWWTLYAASSATTLQAGSAATIPLGSSGSVIDLTSGRYLGNEMIVDGVMDAAGNLGYGLTQDGYFRAKFAVQVGVGNGLSWSYANGWSTLSLGGVAGVLPLGSMGDGIDASGIRYAFGQPIFRAWTDAAGRTPAMITGDGYLRGKLAINTGVANGLNVSQGSSGFTTISLGSSVNVLPLGAAGDGIDASGIRYAGGQPVWRGWADASGRLAAYIAADGTLNAKYPAAIQNAAGNAATALSTANAALAATGTGAASKLKRLAMGARNNNAWDLPVLASPPSIGISTTANATTTKAYPVAGMGAVPSAFNAFSGIVLPSGTSWRLQAVSMPSGGNLSATAQANTQAFEWASDAPSLDIVLPGSPTLWRLIIGGQYVGKSGQAYASSSAPNYAHIDWAGVRAVWTYRVEIEQAAAFGGVNVGPLDSVWAPATSDAFRFAVFGDSYSAGTGASLEANGWANVMGHVLGAPHPTLIALGGTGYLTDGPSWRFGSHLADLSLQAFDAVVWAGGINDAGASSSAIQAAALACFEGARSRLPGAPQFVLGCWPGSSGPNAGHIAAESAIAAAVTALGDANTYFIPVLTDPCGAWISGTGHAGAANGSGNADLYIGGDGTHPNDAGHDYLGRRAASAIIGIYKN